MSREKAELQTRGKSEGPVGMQLSDSGGGRGCGRCLSWRGLRRALVTCEDPAGDWLLTSAWSTS